jgi:internalin A
VLLEEAKTQNCQQANQKLISLSKLSLENNQISDIKPLQFLSQLTLLILDNNKIRDIKPLQFLSQLTLLILDNNK